MQMKKFKVKFTISEITNFPVVTEVEALDENHALAIVKNNLKYQNSLGNYIEENYTDVESVNWENLTCDGNLTIV